MAISYEEYRKKYNDNLNEYQNNARKQTVNTNTVKTTNSVINSTDPYENYKIQKSRLETANKNYSQALSNQYQKLGVFQQPKQIQKITLPTTQEEKKKNEETFKTNLSTINEEKFNQAKTNVKPLEEKADTELNKFKYARYLKTAADVEKENTSLWDKTGGVVLRGLADLASNIGSDKYKYKDENGKTVYLPNYSALKQEKVMKDYSTPVGKFLGDVGYNTTKILGSVGLDVIAPGTGSALYWTDMAADNYKNAVNQGYDGTKAALYSLTNTGFEYLTGKLLGGATGKLTGGSARELDKAASNVFNKLTGNATVSRILGTAFSEGSEEFIQEYLDNISRIVILGDKIDITDPSILGDALYSAAVGAASGGLVESANGSDVTRNIKLYETFKEQLEQSKANTKDKTKINEYDKIINNINNYLENPFSIDEKSTENIETQTGNIDDSTLSRLQQIRQQQEYTKASLLNQQEQQRQQQMLEEINNKVNEIQQERKAMNLPTAGTEGMNLQQSAARYGINPTSEAMIKQQQLFTNRGIEARYDGTLPQFKDPSVAGIWTKDTNGNRSVILNPNASEDTIIQSLAIHELTHDLMSSENSREALRANEIIDYVKTLDEYDVARSTLEKAYADIYDRNNPNFNSLIDEEVVADVLGKKLGNQEFINRLTGEKPSLARRIYNWVLDKLDNFGKSSEYKKEKKFWQEVAKRFENAYKMEYNNSTQADTRLARSSDIARKLFPNDVTVDDLIADDPRKSDFKKWSNSLEYFKLPFEVMEEINAKVSKKAHNAVRGNDLSFTEQINADNQVYAIYADIFSEDNYSITNAELLREDVIGDVDERIKKQNNGLSTRDGQYEQGNTIIDTESNGNRGRTQAIPSIPTSKQTKTNNKGINQESITDSRKELKDGSFSSDTRLSKENAEWNNFLDKNFKTQEERISELNKRYNELDETREITFDERDNLRKELNDLIRSEEYKNAESKFKEMIKSDMTPDEISKTPEYKIMEQEENIRKRLKDYDADVKYMTDEMTKISEMIENEEKEHRSPEKAIKEAKKFFGTTDNFNEAGYLLQDGTLLDFSGRTQGSNTYGRRTLDHREINEIGYDMDEFIDLGNIRMKPESSGFEISKPLTKGQKNVLRDYIDILSDDIIVDITKDGHVLYDSATFKKGTSASKIFNDIETYFETGKFPTKSEYADFYYSKKSKDFDKFINKNIKSTGTTTKLGDLKLPTAKKTTLPSKTTTETKKASNEAKIPIKEKVEKTKENKGIEALKKAGNIGRNYLQLKQSEVKQLKEDLREFTGKTKEQLTNAKTYNKIKDTVEQFMTREIEHLDYDMKQVKNQIKNTNIKVDSSLKDQITDYNYFRKSNFGKLKLGNTGQSVDSVYQELSGMYPYYFNPEIDTEADMLYEISDFMNKSDKTIEKYNLSDSELQRATDKIFNSLINDSLSNEDIETIQNELMEKYSRRTRKVVQEELLDEMGITEDDISVGKDISALDFQRTDPIRLNEKVFGAEIGKKINDATINKTKHNEAERTRFLNKEREEIKDLGIKPRSKESAAVQKYGEKQYLNDNNELVPYGDKELARDFPNVDTQNKIKHAAEVLRGKYDRYIDDINAVITNMGYDAIPKRPDYMRHFQEINDKLSQWGVPLNPTSMNENNIPTDINGLTDQFKPGKNWFASAMQRKGLKTTYDAITGIDGYLEGASNLIYHTEDIQRYRALSKLVRDTYGQTHGMDNIDPSTEKGQKRLQDIFDNKLSKYAAWLDEQANALAGKKGGIDRAAERLLGRKIYSVLDAAKKQVGSNMTGFNVRSALTNFASAVQGASKTNKLAFLKGTISTMQNIIHDDGLINKSDFLTSRFGSDQLSKKLWQKASNAGQAFMTGTDYFTANQIWRGKYYENLSKGMTEKQAIKNADDFAARIMGDRSKGSTAEVFNSKTLGLLTQFQLEVNNQWSSIMHDNKMDIKTGNKSGATVMFQLGQLAALSYLFNGLMKSLTGSDVMIDPIDMLKKIIGGDDDDDKTPEERAREVMGDLINDVPFVSFMTGGRIPMSEAFKGAETGLKYLTGQKDKYNNDIKIDDVKKDLIESAYYWLLPTGYGQIKKTTKGASMYDKKLPVAGSYTASGNLRFTADESTGGKAKALLFGQYTSKEAQKYIESGYKSISKSRLDELKELGMSASQYRKYREGLNKAGTKQQDKIDYISKSNYSDSQKNIMAKNVLKRDIDMQKYKNYGSLEEMEYAKEKPEKYLLSQQIASYDKYTSYKTEIKKIQDNTSNDKEETIKYINSLNMSVPQKAMFIKQYYKSFKQYDGEIVNYINSQKLTTKEKTQVLEQLGFTVKDGRVYY